MRDKYGDKGSGNHKAQMPAEDAHGGGIEVADGGESYGAVHGHK